MKILVIVTLLLLSTPALATELTIDIRDDFYSFVKNYYGLTDAQAVKRIERLVEDEIRNRAESLFATEQDRLTIEEKIDFLENLP